MNFNFSQKFLNTGYMMSKKCFKTVESKININMFRIFIINVYATDLMPIKHTYLDYDTKIIIFLIRSKNNPYI